MQQSRGSPIPPNMIPAPAGTRLSRCSTTSSARYYSRSSLGSSSSNTSGRSRSISATYQRADKTTACSALFAKRASTGSHLLLRKAVGRSTNTITIDDAGYESDFEEEHTFDPVDSLRIRFNKSPKTPTTLRALRIMEQRTGTSSIAPIDMNNNNTTSQIDDKRRERKPSVEDWSDDYDIPESAERIVRSESPKHIPAFPSNQVLASMNIDTTVAEAMQEAVKYEPLAPPVDAFSEITDKFYSQGGFTRASSAEEISLNHAQDNSLDIEEMMAGHADFANGTQLLNKTDNLDFSTTSFQVWRDVPSSLSIESFSNSLILAPMVKNENNPFSRTPLQPKSLVCRTPSKLRNEIKMVSPDGAVEVDIPEIVFHDATEGSFDPNAFPGQIFETYPPGMSTLPIWADSVSFFTALEGTSEGDLVSLGEQLVMEEVQNLLGDSTSMARSLAVDSLPTTIPPNLFSVSDSDLKSLADSLKLNERSPVIQSDSSPEHTTISTSASIPASLFASSLPYQLEATRTTSPIVYGESVSFLFDAGGVAGSPAQAISASMFSARLPALQQGLTGEDLDIGAIIRLEVAASRLHLDDGRDPAALGYSFQDSAPVATRVGPGMSISPSSLAACNFPSIESLVSLPDFYEFSNAVPINVFEQPFPARPLVSNGNDAASLEDLDFEDALLRSLPAPVTKLSAEEARDWGRTVEVCVITPSPTFDNAGNGKASAVTATNAPSVMDETPPLDGEIFAVDDAAGLRDTREQEEGDIILSVPLSVNDVLKFAGRFRINPSPEPWDLVGGLPDVVGCVESALCSDNQNNVPPSISAGLVIVGVDSVTLDGWAVQSAFPPHTSFSPSASGIDHIGLVVRELPRETDSVFPSATILDVNITGAVNVVEVSGSQPEAKGAEQLSSSRASRANGYTKCRVSAIERWRRACAKVECLSYGFDNAPRSPFSVTSMSSCSAGLSNLCRSKSSPPCTQQSSSLIAMTQAAQAPVARAQSFILGYSTHRDVHTRKANGCAHKRRSKRTRSSPKSSLLSKASGIPTALRSNTARVASTEETGAELLASLSPTPTFVPTSLFAGTLENSVVISSNPLQCLLGGERQPGANASGPTVASPPQSPSICHNPDITTSEGCESGGVSFWGSPAPGKHSRLRRLFKRPGLPEGYVGASTTLSGGPSNLTNLGNASVSRHKSRRLWFTDANHRHRPPSIRGETPTSPILRPAATPAPLKSPKRKGLNLNWIRAAVPATSSLKPSIGSSSDSMPMPQAKIKGGRLGAVVCKLQSLL